MRARTLLVLLLLSACGREPPPVQVGGLPPSVLDLNLIERAGGDPARALIARLHPGPLAPAESEVGFYGSGDRRAVLYVSRFASADTAHAQLAMMAAMIGRGRGGFGHHSEVAIGGTAVHATLGQGRAHFFYTRGAEVVWLAADPAIARPALAELLSVPLDSIPHADPSGGG
jgi:hypothetical protein